MLYGVLSLPSHYNSKEIKNEFNTIKQKRKSKIQKKRAGSYPTFFISPTQPLSCDRSQARPGGEAVARGKHAQHSSRQPQPGMPARKLSA